MPAMCGRGARSSALLAEDWSEEPWIVNCPCGVNYDDGEEMVECDACSVWVHTKCCKVPKGLHTYVCVLCKSKKRGGNGTVNEEFKQADMLLRAAEYGDGLRGKGGSRKQGTGGPATEDASFSGRVHVHGVPGGDARTLRSSPNIFSRQLWKSSGLTPKSLRFQTLDLPRLSVDENQIKQLLSSNHAALTPGDFSYLAPQDALDYSKLSMISNRARPFTKRNEQSSLCESMVNTTSNRTSTSHSPHPLRKNVSDVKEPASEILPNLRKRRLRRQCSQNVGVSQNPVVYHGKRKRGADNLHIRINGRVSSRCVLNVPGSGAQTKTHFEKPHDDSNCVQAPENDKHELRNDTVSTKKLKTSLSMGLDGMLFPNICSDSKADFPRKSDITIHYDHSHKNGVLTSPNLSIKSTPPIKGTFGLVHPKSESFNVHCLVDQGDKPSGDGSNGYHKPGFNDFKTISHLPKNSGNTRDPNSSERLQDHSRALDKIHFTGDPDCSFQNSNGISSDYTNSGFDTHSLYCKTFGKNEGCDNHGSSRTTGFSPSRLRQIKSFIQTSSQSNHHSEKIWNDLSTPELKTGSHQATCLNLDEDQENLISNVNDGHDVDMKHNIDTGVQVFCVSSNASHHQSSSNRQTVECNPDACHLNMQDEIDCGNISDQVWNPCAYSESETQPASYPAAEKGTNSSNHATGSISHPSHSGSRPSLHDTNHEPYDSTARDVSTRDPVSLTKAHPPSDLEVSEKERTIHAWDETKTQPSFRDTLLLASASNSRPKTTHVDEDKTRSVKCEYFSPIPLGAPIKDEENKFTRTHGSKVHGCPEVSACDSDTRPSGLSEPPNDTESSKSPEAKMTAGSMDGYNDTTFIQYSSRNESKLVKENIPSDDTAPLLSHSSHPSPPNSVAPGKHDFDKGMKKRNGEKVNDSPLTDDAGAEKTHSEPRDFCAKEGKRGNVSSFSKPSTLPAKYSSLHTSNVSKNKKKASNSSQFPTNDEELALLLHQELNSSPRVPRSNRVSSWISGSQARNQSSNGSRNQSQSRSLLGSNTPMIPLKRQTSSSSQIQQVSKRRKKDKLAASHERETIPTNMNGPSLEASNHSQTGEKQKHDEGKEKLVFSPDSSHKEDWVDCQRDVSQEVVNGLYPKSNSEENSKEVKEHHTRNKPNGVLSEIHDSDSDRTRTADNSDPASEKSKSEGISSCSKPPTHVEKSEETFKFEGKTVEFSRSKEYSILSESGEESEDLGGALLDSGEDSRGHKPRPSSAANTLPWISQSRSNACKTDTDQRRAPPRFSSDHPLSEEPIMSSESRQKGKRAGSSSDRFPKGRRMARKPRQRRIPDRTPSSVVGRRKMDEEDEEEEVDEYDSNGNASEFEIKNFEDSAEEESTEDRNGFDRMSSERRRFGKASKEGRKSSAIPRFEKNGESKTLGGSEEEWKHKCENNLEEYSKNGIGENGWRITEKNVASGIKSYLSSVERKKDKFESFKITSGNEKNSKNKGDKSKRPRERIDRGEDHTEGGKLSVEYENMDAGRKTMSKGPEMYHGRKGVGDRFRSGIGPKDAKYERYREHKSMETAASNEKGRWKGRVSKGMENEKKRSRHHPSQSSVYHSRSSLQKDAQERTKGGRELGPNSSRRKKRRKDKDEDWVGEDEDDDDEEEEEAKSASDSPRNEDEEDEEDEEDDTGSNFSEEDEEMIERRGGHGYNLPAGNTSEEDDEDEEEEMD